MRIFYNLIYAFPSGPKIFDQGILPITVICYLIRQLFLKIIITLNGKMHTDSRSKLEILISSLVISTLYKVNYNQLYYKRHLFLCHFLLLQK